MQEVGTLATAGWQLVPRGEAESLGYLVSLWFDAGFRAGTARLGRSGTA